MAEARKISCLVAVDGAQLYCETAGKGTPFVMIHAGIADCRQWNNEFVGFAEAFHVVRYDMRGFGRSEPVEGDFSHLRDLVSVLDTLQIGQPAVIMGCSMGAGLALDFALEYPTRVRALILVSSALGGYESGHAKPSKFKEAEQAFDGGDLDLAAELETQTWFDGEARTPQQVDQPMRRLVVEMDRLALAYEARHLGRRLPNTTRPPVERLRQLEIPVLLVVGSHDTQHTLAAADYMLAQLPSARKVVIEAAAHLPNLEHPEEFQAILESFVLDFAT